MFTYLGIGGRVREYKKQLAKLSNSTRDPKEQELHDHPTAQGPVTPSSTVPIHLFFVNKNG